jgi:hypothetical protein
MKVDLCIGKTFIVFESYFPPKTINQCFGTINNDNDAQGLIKDRILKTMIEKGHISKNKSTIK